MRNRIISTLLVIIFGLTLCLLSMSYKPIEVVNVNKESIKTTEKTGEIEEDEINYIKEMEELEEKAEKMLEEKAQKEKEEEKKKAEAAKKEAAKKSLMRSLGKYKLTAYCACSKCCGKSNGITASGTKATQGRTVACNSLAIGTKININGHDYVVEDRGTSHIDIFFNSHQEALKFGVKYAEVFIYE